MFACTRNGVVFLMLVGVLAARVEGLKCFVCPACTSDELKGKESECDSHLNINQICLKTIIGDQKPARVCLSNLGGVLKNECKKEKNGEVCSCDTDLCNGAKLARPPPTLVATMALICSLSAIATITGRNSMD